jgi:hypothetical protein
MTQNCFFFKKQKNTQNSIWHDPESVQYPANLVDVMSIVRESLVGETEKTKK